MNETTTEQKQTYFKIGYNEGKHYTEAEKIWKQLTAKQQEELQRLQLYWDCTNYLAAAQIYLRDNFLLREPLLPEHIKDRLLGHWGTCPGINLLYAHLNYMLRKHEDLNLMFVLGPGHGNSAMLANVWISRELEEYYPKYEHSYQGLGNLIKGFSYPGGFPSHVNPQVPGAIHEGGELGYSLSVSYGAVLNQPDLMVACLVGDGESETGPTATAWHAHKFIDPKESGAVIPVLHLNGYKISSATIPGAMTNEELIKLYEGYGYQVRIVENLDMIHVDMMDTLEWAYQQIRYIQYKARSGNPIFKPKWPMIIMKTPKGWTGVKTFHGEKIEGNYLAHQVPLKDCKTNFEALKAIETWFRSYHLENLFNEDGTVKKYILEACAPKHRGMGINKYTHHPKVPMEYPDIMTFAVKSDVVERGKEMKSCTFEAGKYLAELYRLNPTAFKIFSPDELASNKLDYILKYTNRNFQAVEATANKGGGVIEMLSEHTLQGMLQGYLLTGRYGIFPSYEAFLPIVNSMMNQYAKFLKVCAEVSWRFPVPSLNYIESSTLWRQEHNGFSHQNPSFINSIINMKSKYVRVYLPPDANCLISTVDHCMRSSNYINLVISSKNDTPNWLTMEEAIEHCRCGVSVWKWCSTDEGANPDIVLVGIGNETTTEVVAASCILQHYVRKIRVRVVNITDLMILELDRKHPHGLTNEMFDAIFTKDKPVIINFHGYPSAVKQLIYGRKRLERIHVNGYEEEGTTTTPFHMLTSNNVSRYDVAIQTVQELTARGHSIAIDAPRIISDLKHILKLHSEYILEHGKDPEEIEGIKFIERWLHRKKRRGSSGGAQQAEPKHDLEYPMSLVEEHNLIMKIKKEEQKTKEQKHTSFAHPHIQEDVDRSAEQQTAI